ncbi:MAG TPA: hypothetical protein VK431_01570 [Nitrosopumilaceae archaeon]|nr:hypothetical protein [Nitrosopumilaceae archaeon]
MKKKFGLFGIIIGVIAAFIVFEYLPNPNEPDNTIIKRPSPFNQTTTVYDAPAKMVIVNNTIYVTVKIEGNESSKITIPANDLLFTHKYFFNENHQVYGSEISPNPINYEIYKKIGLFNTSKKIVFVYPIFTQAAYDENGFYYYYNKLCDSRCLTVKIPEEEHGKYTSSIRATAILSILNYSHITDIDIDKNPDILKKFDRVIILHNEYVTQKEFDAITSHPDVVYLFPNALYAEVKTDYTSNTITLIRGHGYPDSSVSNGFDWKFENSQYEYDNQCDNWFFYKIDNGKMLNCYPSFRMYYDRDLLTAIKQ